MLESHQVVVDPCDVVGVPGERRAEHGGDADRVLIDVGLDVLGADRVLVGLQRDDPRLDIEVAAELLPHDVHVSAEHEVGAIDRLALLPARRSRHFHFSDSAPSMIASEDPCVRAPVVSARRIEEVGEHPDAALLDLRRLRILGVIDEVHAQCLT